MSKWLPFVILPNCKIRDQRKGRLNFTVKETIGVAIVNPRALAKVSKSTVVGK